MPRCSALRGEPPLGRIVRVDLEELEMLLEGGEFDVEGGYLDLATGDVVPAAGTDPMVGEDAVVDVESEPDRWLLVPYFGGRDAWEDMAAFAGHVEDRRLGERLSEAISGRGAFRRFRDEICTAGLRDRWFCFSAERQVGRARAWLASEGIRALPR